MQRNGNVPCERSRRQVCVYHGYCGIPWHSDREAVSSTLVDVVTRASRYLGTRECFHGVKKIIRYCNTQRLMAKHRHRQTAEYAGAQTTAASQRWPGQLRCHDNPERSIRESQLLLQSTENPREVIPPHTHTYVTSEPTHIRDLRYKSSATEH